ncbi:unnamed protein product [Tilletia laevis]|uniref:Uncharacterized protein n=1 Tax=Tilletia laevis TaxID=157183 RepID=A0A9N8QKP5_9BASI|nr:hypothetical protein CF336_g8484 [Tilletia laevis]KAE8185282.1 hypothetical protein CF328_g7594 [Tilletia controversa]CAD6942060.1 unnamed protein product [Tilletia caries]KAE8185772.1 hypothetical protein CF335_g7631 [Tilletia laevis]CAD6948744.1 unnamed protein product [Tilletia laevis]
MQSYPSLSGSAVGTVIKDGWRFTLSVSDNKALSRALCLRKFGINTRLPPHINIHSWMQKSQSSYKADIAASIVYYQPLTSSSWRLRIIITTQEMQDAAWKYGHNGQLVMDGTFGVSSTKILLFVLLTVDDTGRGLPIGYLIFTPLHGQRTHAGYDTAVLRELLINWSSALGTRHGMQFAPKLAITDTCVRERAAIKSVWPDIQLRLCTFHVRQAWNNHKKQCIRSNGIADNGSSSRALVGESIMNLHKQVIGAADAETARQRVREVESYWASRLQSQQDRPVLAGLKKHCDYFVKFWLGSGSNAFSEQGLRDASISTGIPVNKILTTTNHAEGFNNGLKNIRLRPLQQRGRALRLDMLIIHPNRKRVEATCFSSATSLADFLTGDGERSPQQPSPVRPSLPSSSDPQAAVTAYVVCMWLLLPAPESGSRAAAASCSCDDWKKRGGACKHIRALLLSLPSYAQQWRLPSSEKDAIFLSLDVAQPQSPDPQAGGQTGAQIQLSDSITTDILALVDWGDVDDLVDEEGNDEERGVSDNSSSSIIGDDDEEVGELDGINEVAMLRLERSLDSDDGVKETPIPSSRVDEGLQFQAQSRLRHDTDRAIGMLCDVLKQSASLSLDFRDWAKPDLHHVLASIEEIMKLDTPSRPLGAGIQAARSAPLLMPLPREEKHRRRHPSTSAM